MARRRITQLRARLKGLQAQRGVRRKERKRAEVPTVALAGYTNVGKSTLLNALTGARSRSRTGSSRRSIRRRAASSTTGSGTSSPTRSDSSGAPTQLVQGFASTLEETLVADLILHVVDASLPEDRLREQIAAVDAVLDRDRRRRSSDHARLQQDRPARPARPTTAREPLPRCTAGVGRDGGGARRASRTGRRPLRRPVRGCPTAGAVRRGTALSALYALGAPIDERRDTDAGVLIRAKLSHRTPGVSRAISSRATTWSPRRRRDRATREKAPRRRGAAGAGQERRRGPRPQRLRGRHARRRRAGDDRNRTRGRDPAEHAGLVVPRSGLAVRHGLSIVNAPG